MINKFKTPLVICVCMFALLSFAQTNVKALGNLYVHNQLNGDGIALHQKKIFDKDQGIISTARLKNEDAQILFSKASSWEGASDISYVDGFVKSDHNKAFTFPIGSNGHFKPMACSKPRGISAAYFTNDSSFDVDASVNGVKLLNKSSYWAIQGENPTQLSFVWNEKDNISALVGDDISKLKILAFNGTEWTVLESDVEPFQLDVKDSNRNYLESASNLKSGVISSLKEIVPNAFVAYALGLTEAITETVPEKNVIADSNSSINLSNYKKTKSIHFPFSESKITVYSTYLVKRLAKQLAGSNPRIRLVGHADFFGSEDFNYQLGLDRANAVKQMLASFGLSAVEVDIISNGENAVENNCVKCSKKETLIDRRVDIYVYIN